MIYYILPVSDKTELLCFDCFGLNNDNSYSFMFTDIENKELMKFSEQIKNTVICKEEAELCSKLNKWWRTTGYKVLPVSNYCIEAKVSYTKSF